MKKLLTLLLIIILIVSGYFLYTRVLKDILFKKDNIETVTLLRPPQLAELFDPTENSAVFLVLGTNTPNKKGVFQMS